MEFQKKLLVGCLKDEKVLLNSVRAGFKPYHFDSDLYQYIYKTIVEVSQRDELSAESVKMFVKQDEKLNDDDVKLFSQSIDSLYKEETAGANISFEVLKKKKNEKELLKMMSEGVQAFKSGQDTDDILNMIRQKLPTFGDGAEEFEMWDYWDDYQSRKVMRHDVESGNSKSFKFIKNLSVFDRYFERGLSEEELTAIGGPTYSGKSVLMSNIIRLAVSPENNLNVLYVFAENRMLQAASRLDSIMTGMDYSRLFKNSLTDTSTDSFFETARQLGWGNLKIAKVTPNNFNIDTIREALRGCATDGIDIDMLAIDSPDHMEPLERKNSTWEDKGQVYWEIKQLATEERLITLTTLPMKPSSTKKAYVTAEDAAGSYDISRICDNQIFFNVDPEDKLLGRAKLEVVKNRDGKIDHKKVYLRFESSNRMVETDEEEMVEATTEEQEDEKTNKYKLRQYTPEKDG